MQRIWKYDKIVGYRKTAGKNWYYSKDLLWWNGTAIDFDRADESIGIVDKHNREVFDGDLLQLTQTNDGKQEVIYLKARYTLYGPQFYNVLDAEDDELYEPDRSEIECISPGFPSPIAEVAFIKNYKKLGVRV